MNSLIEKKNNISTRCYLNLLGNVSSGLTFTQWSRSWSEKYKEFPSVWRRLELMEWFCYVIRWLKLTKPFGVQFKYCVWAAIFLDRFLNRTRSKLLKIFWLFARSISDRCQLIHTTFCNEWAFSQYKCAATDFAFVTAWLCEIKDSRVRVEFSTSLICSFSVVVINPLSFSFIQIHSNANPIYCFVYFAPALL